MTRRLARGHVLPPSFDLYIHISQPVPVFDDGETSTIPYAFPSSSKLSQISLVVNLQASENGPSPEHDDGLMVAGEEQGASDVAQSGTGRCPLSRHVWPPSKELYIP